MVNSNWPLDTRAPSVKCTVSITPPTRGRSSTYSAASSRPLNSSLSASVRCTAGATLTGAGPCGPPWASALPVQPASQADAAASGSSQAMVRSS
jgi:hypothetical protein